MNRKVLAWGLIAIWLLTYTAPYLLFQAGRTLCHLDSLQHSGLSNPAGSGIREFTFTDATAIHWKIAGKEIEHQHQLFDVISVKLTHNQIQLKCRRDKKEENLYAHLHKLTRERDRQNRRNHYKQVIFNFSAPASGIRQHCLPVSDTHFATYAGKPLPGSVKCADPPPEA